MLSSFQYTQQGCSRCSQMRFKQQQQIALNAGCISPATAPAPAPVTHGKRHFWHSKSRNHSTEYPVKSLNCTLPFNVYHAWTRRSANGDLTSHLYQMQMFVCMCPQLSCTLIQRRTPYNVHRTPCRTLNPQSNFRAGLAELSLINTWCTSSYKRFARI